MPSYNSVRLNDRKRTTGLREQPIKTNENQSVNWVESELARCPSPKHIGLLPQYQNLGRKRSSRPEKIREHPPDQSAQVPHHATASPDSQSTTSRLQGTASGSGISRSALLRITPVTRTSRSRSQFDEQCSPLQKIRRIEALADRGVRRCEDVVRFRGFTLCTQMTREPDGRPKHEG